MKYFLCSLFGLLILFSPGASDAAWGLRCENGVCTRERIVGPVQRVTPLRTYRSVTGTGNVYRWSRVNDASGNGSHGGHAMQSSGSHGGYRARSNYGSSPTAPEPPSTTADFHTQRITRGDSITIQAFLHDENIGSVNYDSRENEVEITYIAVNEDFRRRGIGTYLVGRVKADAGARRVVATSTSAGAESAPFYSANGFALRGDGNFEWLPPNSSNSSKSSIPATGVSHKRCSNPLCQCQPCKCVDCRCGLDAHHQTKREFQRR